MKKYLLLICVVGLSACQESAKKEVENGKLSGAPSEISIKKDVEKQNINGKWIITEVSGGPVTMFPGGKNVPGIKLDFNKLWKGGVFEFINGVGLLNLPGISQTDIGNYRIEGNSIVFINVENKEQKATFKRNADTMKLYFSPEMYRKTLVDNNAANIEMEIESNIVFHLQKD